MLLGQALMLLILLLLEFLPILFLLREYFFLLLLIFPIHFWVARIRSAGPIRRRKAPRLDGGTPKVISLALFWRPRPPPALPTADPALAPRREGTCLGFRNGTISTALFCVTRKKGR